METQTMHIKNAPTGEIGGEITGLDITTLTSDAPELEAIRQAIYKNKLVVIRNQHISLAQYVAFTHILGTPQVYFQDNYHHPDYPEVFVSSNVNNEGEKVGVAGTGHYWHTDCQFQQHPLSFTSITPDVIPKSIRATYYIDMAKVYQKLPAHLKEIADNVTLIHGGNNRYKVQPSDVDKSIQQLIDYMNEIVPQVEHPAVIEHPVTGEKILYISSGFTMAVKGKSYEESQSILKELIDFAEAEANVYTHSWDKGDLIIWDNRPLLHKSSVLAPGEQSRSYRIGIYDNKPFYLGIKD